MAIEVLTCEVCGKDWERERGGGRKPKYCSSECRYRSRRPIEVRDLTCEICFSEWKWKAKSGGVPKTCSPECNSLRRSRVQKSYRERNPEKVREMKRRYWEENREREMLKHKEWVAENKELMRSYQDKWVKNNPDLRKQAVNSYYARNRERELAKRSERYHSDPEYRQRVLRSKEAWRRNNPSHVQAILERRRARKATAFVEDVFIDELLSLHDNRCGICGGAIPLDVKFGSPLYPHLDHIVPLSKGGKHSYANSQPAHASCNLQKGDKLDGWQDIKPILNQEDQAWLDQAQKMTTQNTSVTT